MEFFSPSSTRSIKMRGSPGFTFVELLVAIIALGILSLVILFVVNPLAQITKAQNATRQHDLEQIKTALDMYYDDTGCYPTTLTFQKSFSKGSKTYMKFIPEDPKCNGLANNCYVYQTDTNASCPQWNVLYSTLLPPLPTDLSCGLTAISSSCTPQNYAALGINYCTISGNVDCATVSSVAITPVPGANITPIPTSPGGGGEAGTPTPIPTIICQNNYACTGMGANGCNYIQTTPSPCTVDGGATTCYCHANCDNMCQ